MGQAEREDGREGFELYPSPAPPLVGERTPREPTNAELEASARSNFWPGGPVPRRTNWTALAAVLAFFLVLVVVTLTLFPLATWEFRFEP